MSSLWAKVIKCQTKADAQPYDVYTVEINSDGVSRISYDRTPFSQSSVQSTNKKVPGCYPAQNTVDTPRGIYIECDGDGDAGYLLITKANDQLTAVLSFPAGNIGYPEDTVLDLICTQE